MNISVFTPVTVNRLMVVSVLMFFSVLLAPAQAVEKGFADLAERLMPAVVNISITTTVNQGGSVMQGSPFEEFFEDFMERRNGAPNGNGGKKEVTSVGSGFVIDPKGIIITNNHVIENAEQISVNFSNGDKYDATLVGRDAKTDIAVLKVNAPKDLPSVRFGDSNKARVGEWVIAIGNPFGLGGSLTAGVISAINRDINSGPYDSFIQSDAAINKGNSGGPLFNMEGEVIGVNTAIISPTGGSVGIGFSVPADMAQTVINQLLEYGETRRGWLGVRIQMVTDDLAEGLGMSKPKGALIAEIIEDGPAAKGGLKAGDVILRFNNKEVAEMRDLPRIVAETGINQKVQVEVLRRGKIVRKSVTVGRLDESEQKEAKAIPAPQNEPEKKDVIILGMQLELLSETARDKAGMSKDDTGVLIAKVAPNSAAAQAGLRGGNVISELDQEQVASPGDVVRLIEQARKDGKKSVLVLLKTPNGLRFIALKVEQKQ